MIILDTNVVSEPSQPRPSQTVLDWLDRQPEGSLFLAVAVIAELSAGAREFARRTGSSRYLRPLEILLSEYEGRILDFRSDAAVLFGIVIAKRNAMGRPITQMDAMIAAICLVHGAALATRNVRDFDGLDLKLINPFEAGA
jgi:predicted nucleic acid-binding protein